MKKSNFLITKEMIDAAMSIGTLEFESCWYKDKECIECTVNEEDSFLLMDVDERFLYEKNIYNPDVYSNEEKISIIYNQLLKDYENDSLEDFKDIQNAFSKILSGGIKDSKSIKQLGSVNQKLYEYCNKTGLRILFMKMDNGKIALSLLFYKDKQKSTKIKAYYMEALKRFELQKDQLNVDDIDFRIEQLQLINEINEVTTKQEVHGFKGDF